MKRTTDLSQPAKTRRALLRNQHPELLTDPAVVAFIDGGDPDPTKHLVLIRSLVRANEPELLLALAGATGDSELALSADPDDMNNAPPLPDGLFEHVAQHINQVPSISALTVSTALLTPAACARLQASLQTPGCQLTSLTFIECSLEDPQTAFIATAPTVTDFTWSNEYHGAPPARQMDRVLPALAHWTRLECVTLISMGAPLNHGRIAQMLLANPTITALRLFSDTAPANAGPQGHPAPENPIHLFENLRNNRTGLTQLDFQVSMPANHGFNAFCIECLAGCLMKNTTLQALMMPGIALCSDMVKQRFAARIGSNRSLTLLGPSEAFGLHMPVQIKVNAQRHIWFSQDFLRGAASEFMRQWGAPHELGAEVARHLSTTPFERTYCAAIVAQLCKATNDSGIRMRSTALVAVIKDLLLSDDPAVCKAFMQTVSAPGLGLLPADKADVIRFATSNGRLSFLPAGYAH